MKQKSYGLDIVRKRLELMPETMHRNFNIEMRDLQNTDGSNAGTAVILQLPFKINTV